MRTTRSSRDGCWVPVKKRLREIPNLVGVGFLLKKFVIGYYARARRRSEADKLLAYASKSRAPYLQGLSLCCTLVRVNY